MKLKKVLALLVCFALIISAFPALAQPEDIKWVCKRSTRIRNSETGELWYPEIPEGYGDYFVDWSGISHDTPDWWGHSLHISNSNGWLSYRVPVETEGVYELFTKAGTYPDYGADIEVEVNGSVASTARIDTGDWEPNATVSLGYIPLNSGENDIKINFSFRSGGALAIYYYWLEPIEAPVVKGFSANDTAISNEDIIPRGTDLIEVELSNPIDDKYLSGVVAVLTDGENEISTVLDSADNKLIISFTDTLDYNKDYSLSVKNIKDIYGYTAEEASISFTASDVSDDKGTASAIITESPDMQDTKTMKVSGIVKNSNGDGISGRKAHLEITDPEGTSLSVQQVESQKGGAVEFSYELDNESLAGIYTVKLTSEYFEEGIMESIRYISESLKKQILDSLELTSDWEDVRELFGTYSRELGIDLGELDEEVDSESGEIIRYGISDKEKFFERFVGASFESIDDFANEYELNMSIEQFVQNSSEEARKNILASGVFPELDVERMTYISAENEAAFCSDLAALTRENTETSDKLNEAYTLLTNKYFLKQNSKADIVLDIQDVSVYEGEQAEFVLSCAEASDIKEYKLYIDSKGDFASYVGMTLSDKFVVSKKTEDGKAVFEISKVNKDSISSLGIFTYDTTEVEERTFTIGGSVVYEMSEFPYEMYAQIDETEVKLSVEENEKSSGPSYSSSPSRGGKVSGGSIVNVPSVTPSTTENFVDLDDVLWAKDSINYLYEKGIISPASDKKFRPGDSVTRAEFVKMLVMSLGINENAGDIKFGDVSRDAWYYDYVAAAVHYGLIKGNDDNCFEPDAGITRQDICVILSRAMDKLGYTPENYNDLFADNDKISDYAVNAVYRLRDFGVVNGVGDNRFDPTGSATRAMTAKIIEQFLKGVKA